MTPLDKTLTGLDGNASEAEVSNEYHRRGWTDGLPIVSPTRERVDATMETVASPADHLLGAMGPRRGQATVEKVAINAVMAGCLPEHFPVVAAAVEAVTHPDFQLDRLIPWTGPTAPLLVINGPLRKALDINCEHDLFGPGSQANVTIGRALRLALLNIGGAQPGAVTKSPHGQPGRLGMCIGENEEESPWEPFHTEQEFDAHQSTVTAFAVSGTAPIFYRMQKHRESADDLLEVIASCLRYVEGYATAYHQDGGLPLLILCPLHARTFAEHGWSKDRVRESLAARIDLSAVYGEEARLNAPTCILPGQADDRSSRLPILVSGGVAGYHSTFLPTLVGVPSITKEIHPIGTEGQRL